MKAINFSTPVNEDTDLVTLKFKVKADVPAGKYETAINYKLFTVYDNEGNERVDLANRGITVNIGNVSENPGNENETENEVTNNETNNETKNETENTAKNEAKEDDSKNETKNNVNNEPATTVVNEDKNSGNNGNGGNKAPTNGAGSQKDESVSPTNLPKTGYRLIIIPIVIIAIVGLVFYKKYSKYNKFDNK